MCTCVHIIHSHIQHIALHCIAFIASNRGVWMRFIINARSRIDRPDTTGQLTSAHIESVERENAKRGKKPRSLAVGAGNTPFGNGQSGCVQTLDYYSDTVAGDWNGNIHVNRYAARNFSLWHRHSALRLLLLHMQRVHTLIRIILTERVYFSCASAHHKYVYTILRCARAFFGAIEPPQSVVRVAHVVFVGPARRA